VCQRHSAVLAPVSYTTPAPISMPTPSGGDHHDETRWHLFIAVPEAVGAARRFATDALMTWGLDHLVEDGSLVVSELATNAVLHGGSPFRVSIARSADGVRIVIEDAGPGQPQRRASGSSWARRNNSIGDHSSRR